MTKNTKKKHYKKIEQLRLFLCLAVLLYHLNILKGGYLAVASFLVLSGYLSVISLKDKGLSFKDYYLNRFKRIYLPLLFTVFSCLGLISLFKINYVNLKPETTSVLLAYNNYWQLSADADYFVRNISSPFMHLWYIAILIQYEILFPFVYLGLKACAKKISKLVPLIILLLLIAGSYFCFYKLIIDNDLMKAYYGSFARFFAYGLGVALGFYHESFAPSCIKADPLKDIIFYGYLLILFISFIFVGSDSPVMAIVMLGSCIITMRIISYGFGDPSKPKTWERTVNGFSRFSYELYLVQYPVIFLFESLRIPYFLKLIPIILLIFFYAFLIFMASRLNKKTLKNPLQIMIIILVMALSFVGVTSYIKAEDHTAEMEELKNKLDANQKLIEEKNKEYLESVQAQQNEWDQILLSKESDEATIGQMLERMPLVGIGDSIMIDIGEQMYERFPNGYFDGKVSRDLYTGEEILESLKDEGKLSDTIVLCLATNGDYITAYNEKLMEIVGDRQVFWVNATVPDDPEFNKRFEDFAQNYPNLHIVDWASASEGHPEYFYYDNIHVMEEGCDVLADLIYNDIYNFYLNKFKNEKDIIIAQIRENINSRIAFYGNDALIYSYNDLSQAFEKAAYYTDRNYSYDSLYKELSEKTEAEALEHKIVMIFDSSLALSKNQYNKLIDLLKEHELYIVLLNDEYQFDTDNVKVIDMYSEIEEHPEYLASDGVHLTDQGNQKLKEMISAVLS
ncbi:MAG: acyltransferase [Erysipelotrichaceae bacterium]|nr:acyltransferase [Erysipelotrichaceae bacterium]